MAPKRKRLKTPVRVGVVGTGRWGKNLLREFYDLGVLRACYSKSRSLAWVKKKYPGVRCTHDLDEVLKNPELDAIVVATPIRTHFSIAQRALEAKKHVFVEKPLAQRVREARALVRRAKTLKRTLFVGHVFVHHPVFGKILEIHARDPVESVESVWTKMGSFDESIVDNLFSHEAALCLALFRGERPAIRILGRARGVTQIDVLDVEWRFSKNRSYRAFVNRLSGSNAKVLGLRTRAGRLLAWDRDTLWEWNGSTKRLVKRFSSRREALRQECEAFLGACRRKKSHASDGAAGERVVEALAAIKAKLR